MELKNHNARLDKYFPSVVAKKCSIINITKLELKELNIKIYGKVFPDLDEIIGVSLLVIVHFSVRLSFNASNRFCQTIVKSMSLDTYLELAELKRKG